MNNFWIIVPAWKRYEISKLVFPELRWLKKRLSKECNIEVLVVSDDKNIDIASSNGLKYIRSSNDFLGKKFNDGYEYAFNHGADAVIPSGSDSWVHPDAFKNIVKTWYNDNTIWYSTKHAMVSEDGSKLGIAKIPTSVDYNKGALWFYPRKLMKMAKFRPCNEKQKSSCDRSTINGLKKSNKVICFKENDIIDLQYLAFKNNKVQIWSYSDYNKKFIIQINEPWDEICKFYPKRYVNSVIKYYHGD